MQRRSRRDQTGRVMTKPRLRCEVHSVMLIGSSGSSVGESVRTRPCRSVYTAGSTISVAAVAKNRPPMTARPSGAVCARSPVRAPSGSCRRSSRGGHQDRPAAVRARLRRPRRAPTHRRAGARRTSPAESRSRPKSPIAMIAPMNDCTFSVVPVSSSISEHAADHRRHWRRSPRAPAGTTGSSPPAAER